MNKSKIEDDDIGCISLMTNLYNYIFSSEARYLEIEPEDNLIELRDISEISNNIINDLAEEIIEEVVEENGPMQDVIDPPSKIKIILVLRSTYC